MILNIVRRLPQIKNPRLYDGSMSPRQFQNQFQQSGKPVVDVFLADGVLVFDALLRRADEARLAQDAEMIG